MHPLLILMVSGTFYLIATAALALVFTMRFRHHMSRPVGLFVLFWTFSGWNMRGWFGDPKVITQNSLPFYAMTETDLAIVVAQRRIFMRLWIALTAGLFGLFFVSMFFFA